MVFGIKYINHVSRLAPMSRLSTRSALSAEIQKCERELAFLRGNGGGLQEKKNEWERAQKAKFRAECKVFWNELRDFFAAEIPDCTFTVANLYDFYSINVKCGDITELFAAMSTKLENSLFPDITINFLANDARSVIDGIRRKLGCPQLMGEKVVTLTPTIVGSLMGDYDTPLELEWKGTIEVNVYDAAALEPKVYTSKDILQRVITEYSLNKLKRL
jgi:hypothetical protein